MGCSIKFSVRRLPCLWPGLQPQWQWKAETASIPSQGFIMCVCVCTQRKLKTHAFWLCVCYTVYFSVFRGDEAPFWLPVTKLVILQYTQSLHTWEMTKWFHFPASLCLYLKSSMPLLRFQIPSWPSSSLTHPPRVIPSLVPHPRGVKTLSGAFPVRWELTGKAPDRHRCLPFPVISWRGKPLRRHYSSKDKYDRGMWWGDNQERKGERQKAGDNVRRRRVDELR